MKFFSKTFVAAGSALMLMTLAACGGDDTSSGDDDSDTVSAKIGVVSFLSGSGSAYGEAITNGLKLAQKEINDAGDVDIDLEIEDSGGEPDEALSAAQKLMNSEDVTGIIGPTISTEWEVVAPEADTNGVPIMGTSIASEGMTEIGDYVFRDSIPEMDTVPEAVEAAMDQEDAETVAIMYGNDDVVTKAGYDAMKKAAEDLDLEVLTTEEFQQGDSDYKAQLSEVKDQDPDLVLNSALYNEGAVIMKQAREMGIDVPFVGGNGFNSPEVVDIAGDAADDLIVATPWYAEEDDDDVQEFVEDYEDEYDDEPDQFAAQAYDGLYIIADALERAGEDDRDKLQEALLETEDMDGILGDISLDEEGDVVMEPKVLKIEDGEYQKME